MRLSSINILLISEMRLIALSIPDTEATSSQFLKPLPHNGFFSLPTSAAEIEQEISKLNVLKARTFSIPTKIFKLIKTVISKPLEVVFNIYFATGIVPDKLKIARAFPIFKTGLESNLSNYRPISLLPVFNIVLEKLVYKRLIKFIEKRKLSIYDKLFGFRSHH